MDDFYISFDTRIKPGSIQAIKVSIGVETSDDDTKIYNLALRDHPLYRDLVEYVRANPL